jgi:serpin B
VDTVRDHYRAPIASRDFTDDPEAARGEINDWVAELTASKIPELLTQGQITRETVMAVVNAIYFKADWATAFDTGLTRPDTFYRADATAVSVEMMSTQRAKLRTSFDGDARWIELPYRTGEVSFLAYTREASLGAGASVASVQALQDDLEDVDLNDVVASLHETTVVLQLPRFSMRSRLDLIPVFKQLGVTDLFDGSLADLEHLSMGGGVAVNPFVHEAAIWVDELGTVAAAATAAVVGRFSPRVVRFDHPFLFFIRDNRTGAILFSGRVADPAN